MDFERLYQRCHAAGGMSRYAYEDDPKRLAFTLARYKHTAKLLDGCGHVIEVGCADGFGTRIVRQHVAAVTAIDVDAASIAEASANVSGRWPVTFRAGDIMSGEFLGYDAVYALDVFEHVPPEAGARFLGAMRAAAPVAVIGVPSLESQVYASDLSRRGHVNCQSGTDFKRTLKTQWGHVFVFSLNDEAIGTGFLPMAHYLLALCVA